MLLLLLEFAPNCCKCKIAAIFYDLARLESTTRTPLSACLTACTTVKLDSHSGGLGLGLDLIAREKLTTALWVVAGPVIMNYGNLSVLETAKWRRLKLKLQLKLQWKLQLKFQAIISNCLALWKMYDAGNLIELARAHLLIDLN